MSASTTPDVRIKRYVQWYSYVLEGRSEDSILRSLHRDGLGEFGSAQALYSALTKDGFPVCKVCGQTPVRAGHCDKPRKKRQPGVGGGHRVKLPDASVASDLFRTALKELAFYIPLAQAEESWLEGNVEEDGFKGKHFITHTVDRESVEVARREEFTPEQWRELCEQHGVESEHDQIALSRGDATPGGVARTPSIFLVALVAAYALTNRPLTPLVEALHHEPYLAAWKEIIDNEEDLRRVAGHLATRVRGGIVGRGRGVEEISREEHFVAWLIEALDEEGVSSDKAALEELRKTFPSLSDGLAVKDIDRIRRERLEPPE